MIVNTVRRRFHRVLSTCCAILICSFNTDAQSFQSGQWLGLYPALYSFAGIRVVATQGGALYAGGQFNTNNNSTGLANYLARWTTNGWDTVGGGLNGPVQAIAIAGNDVYVGGTFTEAGGIAATNIARWDGASWHPVGSGLSGAPPSSSPYGFIGAGVVNAIVTDGTNIYAGGTFTSAGDVSARYAAMWDGSVWSPMGQVSLPVNALSFANGRPYAASRAIFTNPDDFTSASGVVQWTSGHWRPAGLNMGTINEGDFYSIAVNGSDIYVGGNFQEIGGGPNGFGGYSGGIDVYDIAHWNGKTWSDVGGGVFTPIFDGFGSLSAVLTLQFQGPDLYVGGVFSQVAAYGMNYGTNGPAAGFIAKWDGTSWFPVGAPGVEIQPSLSLPYVSSIAFLGGEVVAAGSLGQVGGLSLNIQGGIGDLAGFDGTNWATFGSGVYGPFPGGVTGQNPDVLALANDGTNLYIGGNFTNVAGFPAFGIARKAGGAFSGLNGGMDGPVEALMLDGPNLYAGGAFATAGGVKTPGIALWDGTHWNAFGAGLNGTAYALAKFGGQLVVGGNFQGSGGGASPSYLAVWNGGGWSPLGGGVDGPVYSLLVKDGILYAGGKFANAGGAGAAGIAQWNGTQWSSLAGGLQQTSLLGTQPATVYCLASQGTNLYAGGLISLADGAAASGIAAWDGTHWAPMGSGLDQTILGFLTPSTPRALVSVAGSLYVTGENINSAGGLSVSGLAAWTGSTWQSVPQGLQGYSFERLGAIGSGYALTGFNGEVVVGGAFGAAGGLPASGVAAFAPASTPGNVIPASPPTVTLACNGSCLTVSWPASYLGFTLQSSPDLSPGSWTSIPGSSATNSVTQNASTSQSFFRLRH